MINHLKLLFICLFLSNCSFKVATPPTRFIKGDSFDVLEKGENRFYYESGAAAVTLGQNLIYLSGLYSHGFDNLKEGSANISYTHFEGADSINIRPIYFALDLNLKKSFEAIKNNVAFNLGGGYAYSNYGHVLSPHLGYVAGLDFKYIKPFINYSFSLNIPIDARVIEYRDRVKRPTMTFCHDFNLGLKIDIKEYFYLSLVGGWAILFSETDRLRAPSFALGVGMVR
ncbi:MAG: hypothetical protein A2487_13450 [Candidatus Raymondbacteria bacterium RifOxyC12_full_50_8]|uniref:Outer membrane protein beta-barrel domain-containing protein n=1 Tax=Candidatus Raymondbacteria bacterium RIFOXYD12_FULL_49_13 TaxID=1817890 RepID=A0A1F7F7T9_UNCRA|nr:MAG: hypothetical protein A2248_13560 [Candidatus Raymondbacteria bacterium RIFOXYA2_FULL_49_16]OGJ95152.1 MAG: hypothetical protein A2350_09415 [Candidatus Raymondbacteria bacterium RifOxyB12_full_50_8]OGK00364.1 MAG: hypothetical protein A2487_13450 [Candidatus Raymondbacteria bacterium RifOxyC12_full_50_8]OGK02719.1 MAG: hypothetical protein A2519_09660 [Candidatus Raymondbacteria bacterium RIFOXYD12_FULL_49_13]OGP42365.1 MAG: hypothetical protein A2324_20330 [Candidatus Raymondbacteria b